MSSEEEGSSILKKAKELAAKAADSTSSTARVVGDLNGDGKVDQADAKHAMAWASRAAESIGDEAARIGKEAVRSDLAKDAAAGAAVGAAIGAVVPVVGWAAGAAVGAGLGVYKNMTRPSESRPPSTSVELPLDLHAELTKLDDLKTKGMLTEEEFSRQKARLLKRTP